jgi:hypothetical protein
VLQRVVRAKGFIPIPEACEMLISLFFLLMLLGFPVQTFAQFIDKGDKVEVAQGTRLCMNVIKERAKAALDPHRIFWKVTSKMRANGTQTVAAFAHEETYDRQSGDTSHKEILYEENYATFFKRDSANKGMLLMISPQHGGVEAGVEVCKKGM